MIEIRKIGTINVQLVTGNFATRKHYHLKLSTLKKQLATRKIKFSTHKTHLATRKNYFFKFSTRKKQLATRDFIFDSRNRFATRKITLQLVRGNSQLVNLFS